jgi:hypothetical protein
VSKAKELKKRYWAEEAKNQPSQFWKEPSHASRERLFLSASELFGGRERALGRWDKAHTFAASVLPSVRATEKGLGGRRETFA